MSHRKEGRNIFRSLCPTGRREGRERKKEKRTKEEKKRKQKRKRPAQVPDDDACAGGVRGAAGGVDGVELVDQFHLRVEGRVAEDVLKTRLVLLTHTE